MSDAAAKEKELSDIELCYKAMGLSFSDNPQKVESVYRKLKDDYGKLMRSSDPSERVRATESMKQLEELFSTITGSLIYKDYAREYEKYKQAKAEEILARKQKQEQQQQIDRNTLVDCPYCRKLISPKLKICIYCHGKILSPMELLIEKIFSKRNIVIGSVVLVLIAAAVFVALNPQLFKR